jgi:hypothetical protein
VLATLAVGALLLAGGIAATLSRADQRRMGTNDVVIQALVGTVTGAREICQGDERIPAGTGAVRVSLVPGSEPRPAVAVAVGAPGSTVATGRGHRWDGDSAIVALHPPVAREVAGRVGGGGPPPTANGEVGLFGAAAGSAVSATDDGQPLGARLRFEYLQSGVRSWWSFAPELVDRIGRAHAWSGSSVALLAGVLSLTSILLAAWLLVRPR